MSKRKHGLGLLGLVALIALGVVVFASSAMAVTPQFTVNGVPSTAALDVKFEGTQTTRSTLSMPNLNIEINCEKGKMIGGLIASPTDAKVEKILLEDCTLLEFKAPLAEISICHVSDVHTGNPSVLHITVLNPLLLPVEFASGDYGILAEKISAFINFLSGTGCTLPLKTELNGEICFLITPATNDAVEPVVTSSETIQSSCPEVPLVEGGAKLKDTLRFGFQPAFFTGSFKLKLLAPHNGLTLGVLLQF